MSLSDDKQRLLELLQQGFCPDCGKKEWQHTPMNPTMKIECLACGQSWMIELNVQSWWEDGANENELAGPTTERTPNQSVDKRT